MGYTTQANILGNIQTADLIALTDDDMPPLGVINNTILNQVIENASTMIDQYIGNIYAVPLANPPGGIVSMATTIVCYQLYRRRLVPDEKNNFTEDYQRVIKFLEAVNSAEKTLPLPLIRDFSQVAANTGTTPWGYGNQPYSSR